MYRNTNYYVLYQQNNYTWDTVIEKGLGPDAKIYYITLSTRYFVAFVKNFIFVVVVVENNRSKELRQGQYSVQNRSERRVNNGVSSNASPASFYVLYGRYEICRIFQLKYACIMTPKVNQWSDITFFSFEVV